MIRSNVGLLEAWCDAYDACGCENSVTASCLIGYSCGEDPRSATDFSACEKLLLAAGEGYEPGIELSGNEIPEPKKRRISKDNREWRYKIGLFVAWEYRRRYV